MKEKKQFKIELTNTEFLLLVFVVTLISLTIGLLSGKFLYTTSSPYNNFLGDIKANYDDIKANYGNVKDEDLLEGAITGMLSKLNDPYATILRSNSSFLTEVDGEYSGIGVEVVTRNIGEVIINDVFPNSGAYDAGLKKGDKIIKVDDIDLKNETGAKFGEYIKGSNKKEFTVVIMRDNKEMSFVVTKKKITIPSVKYELLKENNKNVHYLDISIFSGTTVNQFKQALAKVKDNELLIIDLRGNTGGRLDVASDMLSLMFDKNKIIYQTDDGNKVEKFYSNGHKNINNKIIILVDENSASASEIMIGALKEHLGAKLVGKKTYGKGTVQQLKTLPSGIQYKITTKKWLTPNGNFINEKGFEPDYLVEQDKSFFENNERSKDLQLKKALEIITE